MKGAMTPGSSFNLPSVGSGVLWGLILVLVGGLVQGIIAYRSPLSPGAETAWSYTWQALGAVLAGFLAGRRAGGAGLIHGGASGIGLVLTAAAAMGVLTALPVWSALLKGIGAGTVLGAAAGVVGVNFRDR